MSISITDLSKVYSLYHVQIELWRHVHDADLKKPAAKKEAQRQLRQFSTLLNQVDPRYMGGEDVLDALKSMKNEVSLKLRSKPKRATSKLKAVKSKSAKKKVVKGKKKVKKAKRK